MHVWHRRLLDEGKEFLEDVRQFLLLLVVQAQVQVVQICCKFLNRDQTVNFSLDNDGIVLIFSLLTVRLGKVILAGVTNVDDVGDTECLHDFCITGVVPVPKEQPTREDLIWIAICDLTENGIKKLLAWYNRVKFIIYLRSWNDMIC